MITEPVAAPTTVRVALAGCGAVGTELIRVLRQREDEIAEQHGFYFDVVSVLVRGSARARPKELSTDVLTTDLDRFLTADADVVVEAIGGLEPAGTIARAALRAGRRLITANKALIAEQGPELVRLAQVHHTRIDFESAVAGGIPVLRPIRDQLAATGISSIRGILNGTSNYILGRVADGDTFRNAVAAAQAEGYAESDPSRDVNGTDAADKIRILAWLAFGVDPEQLPVRVRGIVPQTDLLADAATLLGGVPRLVAECIRDGDRVNAVVEPMIVLSSSELGQVRGVDNIVIIENGWSGRLRLVGPGAGGAPTAAALLGDLIRGARPLRLPDAANVSTEQEQATHRWIVIVQPQDVPHATLEQALTRAGSIVEDIIRGPTSTGVRLKPTPWSRVDLALRSLRSSGLKAAAYRDETADPHS